MTWVDPFRWGPYRPYRPEPAPQQVWPWPPPVQKQLVDCAACKGTGLNQRYSDGSALCKGCNGAGKQRV